MLSKSLRLCPVLDCPLDHALKLIEIDRFMHELPYTKLLRALDLGGI
jgi:hypothetical protein